MVYTIRILRVQVFLIVALRTQSAESLELKGSLPDLSVIAKLFEQFIKPHIQPVRKAAPVTKTDNSIQKVILDKINELKPFLQDNDLTNENSDEDNEFTLEGKDETTIIDFSPNKGMRNNEGNGKTEILKTNIEKYKTVRDKIKLALEEEYVSDTTKKLVTSTLDDMIATLIGSQCTWNDFIDTNSSIFRETKDERMLRTLELTNKWSQQWQKLKSEYLYLYNNKQGDNKEFCDKTVKFFNTFNEFFSKIIQSIQNVSRKYIIKCRLIDKRKNKALRMKKEVAEDKYHDKLKDDEESCESFKICSEELKEFLIDFYNTLNDTAVSTVKNYAAMYLRDVTADESLEREKTASLIMDIGDVVERKVKRTFLKETAKFKLDKDRNKETNVKLLIDYVKRMIIHSKRHILRNLEIGLKSLRAKLLLTVKQDITVNLNVDLENLERDVTSKICAVFEICNGRYISRKSGIRWANPDHVRDKNSVYVKVQLQMDDKMRNAFHIRRHFNSGNKSEAIKWNLKINEDATSTQKPVSKIDTTQKFIQLNVTRTTHNVVFENITTTKYENGLIIDWNSSNSSENGLIKNLI